MSDLTSRQRAYLRGLAHELRPIHHVGKEGVTDAAARAVEQALRTRELLKVKVLEHAPDPPRATGEALAARVEDAQVVQAIGRVVVLYRPHPDAPVIRLPK